MNIQTIEMDPRIAHIHYKDYRKKVREHREKRLAEARAEITEGNKKRLTAYKKISLIEKEDTVLMASYREMAKGHRLINVSNAIIGAGLDVEKRLPILALARAHWRDCAMELTHGQLLFKNKYWISWSHTTADKISNADAKNAIPFSMGMFPAELTNSNWRTHNKFPAVEGQKAIVPSIPAHLRPEGDLCDYFILFEAKWEKKAPPDPLLLQHVAGQMYIVLAQWDLTEIEKAVLEGRFA